MKKLVIIFGIIILFFLVQRFSSKSAAIEIGNLTIKAEIADTLEKQSLGLMFKENLDENEGMLFIFNGEEYRTFWMKNTLIPLDILFIDENLNIVDIQTMLPCTEESCEKYKSAEPAMYALEINENLAGNLEIGDKVYIN